MTNAGWSLPKVSLGPYRVSRLIVGDNPVYGYSHFNQLLAQHQRAAHSPEQVVATLRRAEEVGINTWQSTLTERSLSDLLRYRDRGGTIHWLCLSTSHWYDEPQLIAEAARHHPIGMAPHGGGIGDRCLREHKLDLLHDILKRIRDTGVMVGLSVHDPRLLQIAEDAGWDIDYYMTSLYHIRGGEEEFKQKFGHAPLGEVYLREHRDTMCRQIRQTSKPCIVFKVLAAGRTIRSKGQIRAEIGYALNHIKSSDALLIGMYQQFGDQIGENAALVAELSRDLKSP